jgi:hypothetical protein
MSDPRTSSDPVSAKIAASRSALSQEQVGSSSVFLPEQAWMIDQAEMDVVDQETDTVIIGTE